VLLTQPLCNHDERRGVDSTLEPEHGDGELSVVK
jgi:hypothetical protein